MLQRDRASSHSYRGRLTTLKTRIFIATYRLKALIILDAAVDELQIRT